jgi:archaellum component FlaC
MMPDSPETRIARLEQKLARVEQRVEDIADDVRALGSLPIGHAEMKLVMEHLRTEVRACGDEAKGARSDLKDLKDTLSAREAAQRKERKTDRRYLITTVLAAAGLVIAAIQVLGGFG